jgi:hypothetical protein
MNAADLARTITSTFAGWRDATRRQDEDAMRVLTNHLDRAATEAVELVRRAGGPGSVVYQVVSPALALVREEVLAVAQRLADAGWPGVVTTRGARRRFKAILGTPPVDGAL